jgi:carbon-monoxide dehydrogenase small subunit
LVEEKTYAIKLTVNGRQRTLDVSARKLLVHALRDDLGLTGTHVGCDTSQCGACAVEVGGKTVKSCTILAVQIDGEAVQTIESIGTANELDPIQAAFKECHALQCGYCTPGMVMATRELLRREPNPNEDMIRNALHGNICRCTGYHNIVEAVQHVAKQVARNEVRLEL